MEELQKTEEKVPEIFVFGKEESRTSTTACAAALPLLSPQVDAETGPMEELDRMSEASTECEDAEDAGGCVEWKTPPATPWNDDEEDLSP